MGDLAVQSDTICWLSSNGLPLKSYYHFQFKGHARQKNEDVLFLLSIESSGEIIKH